MIFAALFSLCAGLTWFDFSTLRVPNAVTLTLLGSGILLNFPGEAIVWATCALLVMAWQMHLLGGGDVKLWMALLWWTPRDRGEEAVLVLGLVLFISSLFQFVWRQVRGQKLYGLRSPAVWRTLPFLVWFWIHA